MGGENQNSVVCCFCGRSLTISDAVQLLVIPPGQPDEGQTLYCHRDHLRTAVHSSIPLHPDISEVRLDTE